MSERSTKGCVLENDIQAREILSSNCFGSVHVSLLYLIVGRLVSRQTPGFIANVGSYQRLFQSLAKADLALQSQRDVVLQVIEGSLSWLWGSRSHWPPREPIAKGFSFAQLPALLRPFVTELDTIKCNIYCVIKLLRRRQRKECQVTTSVDADAHRSPVNSMRHHAFDRPLGFRWFHGLQSRTCVSHISW